MKDSIIQNVRAEKFTGVFLIALSEESPPEIQEKLGLKLGHILAIKSELKKYK